MNDYIAAASAAILAALCLNATRAAAISGRRWLPLAVLTLALTIEAFTAVGDYIPTAVRVARDIACAWVLLGVMPNRKR